MNITGGSIQPDQTLEWDEEAYKANLRWIASYYNSQVNNVPYSAGGAFLSSPTGGNGSVFEYMENLSYYYGVQGTTNYGFFVKDVRGNQTAVPMIRGLDIKKIVDHIDGQTREMVEPLPKTIAVTAYSQNAISQKKESLDYMKMIADQKSYFQLIERESGYGFKVASRNFKNELEQEKFFENFQDAMEIAYMNMAKDSCYTNSYRSRLPKVGMNVTIGNLGMVEVTYKNGRPRWRVIPPELAIVDYTKADDQHEYDDFAGDISEMTIPQLLGTWDWTDTEIQELKSLAKAGAGSQIITSLNSNVANGWLWWNYQNDGVPKVTVVKGQWRSLEKVDGGWVEVLREGVLIGNKFVKDAKISEGQVYDINDRSKKRLKYIIVTPNLMVGTSISIVGMVKRYQDIKDAFATKVTQMVSQAIGKSVVLRASKLPDGLKAPDVIAQLKQAGAIVLDDDAEDETNGQRMVEAVDLTLDPNVASILQIVQYYDGVIADILNIPPSTRGMLTSYQSNKNLQNSQAQSTKGMSYYYDNMKIFFNRLLSYSASLMKAMAPDDDMGRDTLALLVGDSTTELFSMDLIKEMQFEDFLLNLNTNDYMNIEAKERYGNIILQTAANNPTALKDYVMIDKLDTKTEIQNYLEAEEYKKEQAAIAQREAELLAAQTNAKINANAQMAMNQAQVNGNAENNAMNILADQMNQQPQQ